MIIQFVNILKLAQAQHYELPEVKIQSSKNLSNYEISPQKLKVSETISLGESLKNQKGISNLTACGFCGSKRISINGHKGEHTSIFIDGLSLLSSISSFYGVDTIPLLAIAHSEVFLGSSHSHTLPESLAGAIHIKTMDIDYSQFDADTLVNQRGDYQIRLLERRKLNDHLGFLLGFEGSTTNFWDVDHNLIAEFPKQKINHLIAKLQWSSNSFNKYHLRFMNSDMKNEGGHIHGHWIHQASSNLVDAHDFEDGDIRNPYIGDLNKLRDQTHIHRQELALIGEIKNFFKNTMNYGLGLSKQEQNSIYMHGYDYAHQDTIYNGFLSFEKKLFENGEITWGGDYKMEEMRSQSKILFEQSGLTPDHLNHLSMGIFSRLKYDSETLPLESHFSLRYNYTHTHWTQIGKSTTAFLLIPRMVITHQINPSTSQTFSVGMGYRSPLTLFESQHGINHYGLEIQLDAIETSKNIQYSWLKNFNYFNFELTLNSSEINNMAYGLDQSSINQPTVFLNFKEPIRINSILIDTNTSINPKTNLHLIAEKHMFPDAFTEKLPIASIEERINLSATYVYQLYEWEITAQWIGPRNLHRYAHYKHHYNQIKTIDDPNDPNFGDIYGIDPKFNYAPGYIIYDLSFKYLLQKPFQFELNVTNLFDFVQNRTQDQSLTWHLHGNHYHLDNFHLWGPLRGREIWLKIKYIF